jgi:putative ABC transport system permease protein
LSDVRLALRLLRRAPGVAAIAVLSTALSVGAIAAVFTAVQAVLIKPLPYSRPDELQIWTRLDPSSVTLESGFTRDVSQLGHAGTGDLEIRIQTLADPKANRPRNSGFRDPFANR